MIHIKRYTSDDKEKWNDFNAIAKNSLFMFDRNYMDYHSDRFVDHSLMFYHDDKLIALLPMNEKEGVLFSHGGLTYGGFICGEKMRQTIMNECFGELIKYAEQSHFQKIIYKTIPYIYYSQPCEEDRFALFANGAKLVTVDVSTYVNLENPIPFRKNMKRQIKKAEQACCIIKEATEADDFTEFIELENEILLERHNTKAAHSGAELKMLKDRFPENIHLFVALRENNMIGGAVVYEYANVVHTQYMAANEEAREIRALDLTIGTIINLFKSRKKWLDFGISTEHGKVYLNEGLVSQKEGFGGRTGIYEIWELTI